MYEIYKVKPGETLDLIAKTKNFDLKTLYQINKFPPFYTVTQGSEIYIPNNKDLYSYYLVKENDTLDSVSKKYNVDQVILLKLNGLDNGDIIYPGDIILVPNEKSEFYITTKNDNLASILEKTKIKNIDDIKNELYVLEDQLLIFSKK